MWCSSILIQYYIWKISMGFFWWYWIAIQYFGNAKDLKLRQKVKMQFYFATSCQCTGPRGETAVHAILQKFHCVIWSMFGQDNLLFEGYSVILPRVHLASLQQDEVRCLVFIILEYTLGSRMKVFNKFFNYFDCIETGFI